MEFDFKNNFVSKPTSERQSWINNKKHELLVKIDNLKDKINIIKNRESIEQLKIQFLSLENKVNDLKLKINDLLSNSSNLYINCSNITTIVSGDVGLTALSTSTLTPVVGAVIGSIVTIIGVICAINNI